MRLRGLLETVRREKDRIIAVQQAVVEAVMKLIKAGVYEERLSGCQELPRDLVCRGVTVHTHAVPGLMLHAKAQAARVFLSFNKLLTVLIAPA